MAKRYLVTLSEDERADLLARTTKGTITARKLPHAHILLRADAGDIDATIATALHVGIATVERVRKRVVEAGLDAALHERPRPGGQRKLDGKQEAFLIALACSTPPEGRPSWTMHLLAHKLVEGRAIDTISDETVRRTLQKMPSSRGQNRPGVFRASVRRSCGIWERCWLAMPSRMLANLPWSVLMKVPTKWSAQYASHGQSGPASLPGMPTNIAGRGHAMC